MPKILWEATFSVGIKELDDQHKRLIDFMNEIYERLEKDAEATDYRDFFIRLRGHAENHFATEERYFAEFAYPDAVEHTKEHRKVQARIGKLEEAFNQDPSTLVVYEVLHLLDDWLFDHAMMYDKKYTEHFKKHGLA